MGIWDREKADAYLADSVQYRDKAENTADPGKKAMLLRLAKNAVEMFQKFDRFAKDSGH
jgi:hypothetical protein